MAIDFPDSPSVGQTVVLGDKTWTWNGTVWNLVTSSGSDHGTLGGLEDDDHTQYLLADGSRSVSGSILPDTDVTYDLGSATYRFRDLYLSGNSIDLGGMVISYDGSNVSMVPDGGSAQVFATEAYVDTAVSDLIGGAPAALDTLNELAAALDDDASYAATITTALAGKLDSSSYTAADVLAKLITVDGTGSSLDADTLDGSHASAFAASVHTHSYLPLTGGTVTGQTTFSATDGVKITGSSGGIWFDDRNGDGSKYVMYHQGNFLGIWDGVATHHQFHDDGHISITDGGDNNYIYFGPNATWGGQLYVGATADKAGTNTAAVISTDGNLHLDAGDGKTMYLNFYTQGRPISVYGAINTNYDITYSNTGRYATVGAWPSDGNWAMFGGGNGYLLVDGNYSDDDIYLRSYNNSGRVNIGAGNSNTLQVDNGAATLNGTLTSTGRIYPQNWIEFSEHEGLYSPLNGAHFYPNNNSYGSWRVAGTRNSWQGLEFDTSNGQFTLMMTANGNNHTGVHHNGVGWKWYFISQDLYCNAYRGFNNVAGTGNASYHPNGIYSTGTNWLYGKILTNGNDIGQTSQYIGNYYGSRAFYNYNSQGNVGNATINIGNGNGSGVILAFNPANYAPLITCGQGEHLYVRNYLNSAYATFDAVLINRSSKHSKQNIQTLGSTPASAGAMGNDLAVFDAMEIVRKLRPVSYYWYEVDALPRIPVNEDGTRNEKRITALQRLNKIRAKNNLPNFEREDLVHVCGRDCERTPEDPCWRTKNFQNGKVGFIAQEVGEIVPQAAVLSEEREEYESVDAVALIAVLTKAVQDMDARIKELESN
jgi:hypothetical protein